MSRGPLVMYFAWSRPGETSAPLTEIDDRFPALFELRRLAYPQFEELADPEHIDQGIGGFLDHVQKKNFAAFAEQAARSTGQPVIQAERQSDDGTVTLLDERLIGAADTLIVISFDSVRTRQTAAAGEIAAVRRLLARPGALVAICPHHDIGAGAGQDAAARAARELAEHLHHGDRAIPPRQAFGGFARTLLAGLGVPVENRFGLRPALRPDGSPEPIEIDRARDRLGLLSGVETFNAHAHLPQLECLGDSAQRLEVLARQRIDLAAPPHPFTEAGRRSFDALLQSRAETFAGTLLVSDTTLWSSTAGGLASLRKFWSNVLARPGPAG
jgi:hypothetical protein